MRRAGSLMDKISDLDNLYLAYSKAIRGKQLKPSVIKYHSELDDNIKKLQEELLSGDMTIGNYHYFTIFDPKQRQICAADFSERVLHHAIMNVCHPYFERNLIYDTYATRIGKGAYLAIDKGRKAALKYEYVAKLDMKKYFDSISHTILKEKLRRLFKDSKLLAIMDAIIDSYEVTSDFGIPIGNLTSQYFANYYLSSLDHYAKEVLGIPVYLRYMDDILLFAHTKEEVKGYVRSIISYAQEMDKLEVKPPVICRSESGISFLGYRIFPHKLLLNGRSKSRFKKKIKKYQYYLDEGLWEEKDYNSHIIPLMSFAQKAYTKRLRYSVLYG